MSRSRSGPAVVINADDFGLVPEINAAVIEAHELGTITSATMFAAAAASEEAARLAADHPALGVGIHFDLVLGTPVLEPSRIPTLLDRHGRFLARARLFRRALTGALEATEVRAELVAQIERLRALGVDPTHIDGHQHVQVLPTIASAVADVARAEGLPVRVPWVRWRGSSWTRRVGQRSALALLCRRAVTAGIPPATARFASVLDYRQPIDGSLYREMIGGIETSSLEVMVHPALPSAALQAMHPSLYDTAIREGDVLRDPQTKILIDSTGAQLLRFPLTTAVQ